MRKQKITFESNVHEYTKTSTNVNRSRRTQDWCTDDFFFFFYYNITPGPERSTYRFADGFSVVNILFYDPKTACNRIVRHQTSRTDRGPCRTERLYDNLHGSYSLFYGLSSGHYDIIIINNPYKLRVNVHVFDAECRLRGASAHFNGRQPQKTVIYLFIFFFCYLYSQLSRYFTFFYKQVSRVFLLK